MVTRTIIGKGIKNGVCVFEYLVPMVNKRTNKFMSFLHSVKVKKDVWQYEYEDKFIKYRPKDGQKYYITKGKYREVDKVDKELAIKTCFDSLNRKIDRFMEQGFYPLKLGGKIVTRQTLANVNNNRIRVGLEPKKWTDIVILIDNKHVKVFEEYKE